MTPSPKTSLTTTDNLLPFGGSTVTPTSLTLPDGTTFEQWEQVGATLRQIGGAINWWIGDWLNFGARKYGETYAQAVEPTGLEVDTLKAAAWVASSVESCRRRHDLSWSHHKEVAALPAQDQAEWLERAASQRMNRNALRDEIRRARNLASLPPAREGFCTAQDLTALVKHGVRFGTIYVDPPWQYGNQATRAATDNHYPTMTVDQICSLPVGDLAAENSHLHLWTTNGFLFECPRIMAAWGFEYKSCFVWAKPQMGIGNYWRVSHEFLLLGIRGNAPFAHRGLKSWAEIDRGEHSAKPSQVRQMIEDASPGPRLELFGRNVSEGWTVWGNEIRRHLFFQHHETSGSFFAHSST